MKVLVDRPQLHDAVLVVAAAAFAALSLAFGLVEGGNEPTPLSYILAVVACASLMWRRTSPAAVAVAVIFARVLVTWDSSNDVALVPAAALALYSVAKFRGRRTDLAVALGAAVVMTLIVAWVDGDEFAHELLGEAALSLLPIALGDAARSRKERIQSLIDTEAGRRVQAERIRIARDLHDVVAHGLSTIAVQSGVAAHLLDRDPEQARESLEIINATGKKSLEELRAMVGVLRSTDEAPLRPAPNDPNDLGELISGAADAGVTVSVHVIGEFPPDVADASVVAMHRIVQEALTNVARHAGPVPATLSITHGDDSVQVTLTNKNGGDPGDASANSAVPSTGVGVIGMKERAQTLGGQLRVRATAQHGFVVEATLPYHRTAE